MARIRTLKPELWESESLAGVSLEARLLFLGLISHADDEGRLKGNPALVRSQVFPLDEDISIDRVDGWLDELARVASVERYTVDGRDYLVLPRFLDHQIIRKRQKSRCPPPPDGSSAAPVSHEDGTGDVPVTPGMEQGSRNGMDQGMETAREAREPVKKDSPPERVVYERWIAHPQLTQHRRFTDEMRRKAKAALRDRTLEEVCQAVDLYATVLRSERHYWSHQWTLSEFLQRGVEKFAADAQPLTRYLTRDDTNGHPPSAAAIPPRVVALNERRAVSVDEAINRARSAS